MCPTGGKRNICTCSPPRSGPARVRGDCDEGVLEWIHKDRLAALPQWAGDRIFLDLLRQGAPFFSLKLRYQGETLVYACLNGKELTL